MPSVRIEFLKATQAGQSVVGPDNIISDVIGAQNLDITGTAAASQAAPSGTQFVRLTSIGGVALVKNKAGVSATNGIRLTDGQSVYMTLRQGRTVSAMTGT